MKLALLLALFTGTQSTLFAGETPKATVQVDATAARPLRPAIFSTATTYNLEGRRPKDPEIVRIMHAVRPPVLRVPAGNTMNLWDWNTGMARTADQLRQFGADPDAQLNIGPVKGQVEYVRKMGGPMIAERWARLAKEGGSELLWGLNVSTMSAEENLAFLRHLKSANLAATKFELGNELYLGKLWGKEVSSGQIYIQKAKATAQAVKSFFPEAKVAVCIAAPLVNAALNQSEAVPAGEWTAALARESFYDAVVVHSYTFSQELGSLENLTADDYQRWAMVRSSEPFLAAGLAWPGRIFPGKEIWLTEWNLNNRIYKRDHPDVGNRFLPEHTLLSGLFTASYLLNAAWVPSNLAVANYWHLYGGPDFGLVSGEPARERPAFQVFRMLSPAVHECDRLGALTVPDAPRFRGPGRFAGLEAPGTTGFAFFQGDRLKHLAFLNFTDQVATLAAQSKQNIAPRGKAEWLTGEELLPSWNNPRNPSASKWFPKYEVRQSRANLNELTLAPRSFTVVTLE